MNVSPVSDSPGNKRRREYSGIYPHLSVSNKGNSECGIGALAAWNGELWYITYPAHEPEGSDDKLYCLDSSMNVRICPESVGGTHANRMVHRESNQLNIGLYFIDDRENVRVISPHRLRGRCTASARHLTDPENKIYIMTMEEGLYEVDVHTQEVKTLLPDKADTRSGILPGTHGKGACTGQGRLIYSNNGRGGVLAEWDGKEDPGKPESWTIIDRNKYTEITSRGGICGSPEKEDVIWALGWDDKSVLLRICEDGKWDRYRLPKASFTYDADHGWYTEWPRIRSIGRKKLLMDMHGMFYEFPDTFCRSHTAGIRPIARHLKMVADFTDWNGRIAMAADDASMMQNPFLGRPQSNLWFGTFEDLLQMGKPAGWGGVWNRENIAPDKPSEPFLCCGFQNRILHISHDTDEEVSFSLEMDREGTGIWKEYDVIRVPAHGYRYWIFPKNMDVCWVRLKALRQASWVSACFHLSNPDLRKTSPIFQSLARMGEHRTYSGGILYPKDDDGLHLGFAADFMDQKGTITGGAYYEIGEDMVLKRMKNCSAEQKIREKCRKTKDYETDAASVILQDEKGNRYRLPKGSDMSEEENHAGMCRCIREVVTERFLANIHGSFFELPRESAGGVAKIKPVCTHHLRIHDFASWRGMLVLAGNGEAAVEDDHFIRSDDGRTGLWFGNVDDLWRMGAPEGEGGPCCHTEMKAGNPSDPYLMTGYGKKSVALSHGNDSVVTFTIEVDYMADHTWHVYDRIAVPAGETVRHDFPEGFSAHWVRVTVDWDCHATAWFVYGEQEKDWEQER